MVGAIRDEQGESRESTHDLLVCARTAESLEQFLEDEPGRHNLLASLKRAGEDVDLRDRRRLIAPECERPHARVDEQRQARERSAL